MLLRRPLVIQGHARFSEASPVCMVVCQQAAAWPAPGAAQLILAGTETAVRSGGYMEGAVNSADTVMQLLNNIL